MQIGYQNSLIKAGLLDLTRLHCPTKSILMPRGSQVKGIPTWYMMFKKLIRAAAVT
jgi:hypothetical protein